MRQGNAEAAIAEFRKSQAINEAMIKVSPDKPRYRSDLGSDLDSLAVAMSALGLPKVDETFAAANAIFDRLIADHPENIDYRIRQARCLRNEGGVLHLAGRTEQAEPIYRKGLAVLDAADPKLQTADCRRWQAKILFNMGAIQGAGRGRFETLDRHLTAAPGRQAGGRRRPAQSGHRAEQPRDAAGGPQTPRRRRTVLCSVTREL